MTNFTPETIEKTKSANGCELDDSELEVVSGGDCRLADGRLIVSVGYKCEHFGCKICGSDGTVTNRDGGVESGMSVCAKCGNINVCCNECRYCTFEVGYWLCDNPKNKELRS